MIELDLFGSWGRRIIEECKNDSRYPFRLEELEKIPEEYIRKEFAGRISFFDDDTSWIKDIFSEFGYGERNSMHDDYKVISGYFPMGFIPRQINHWDDLDWGDDFGDLPNIVDEVERCKNEE